MMKKGSFLSICKCVFITLLISLFSACGGGYGGGGGNGGGGGGGGNAPGTPTGLAATASNQQVALTWTATAGATSYHVKRSTTTGGPYTQVGAPSNNTYTDTGLTNGTTYYYVVSALNSYGESGNSSEVSGKPAAPTTAVHVSIDVMADRHYISPFVYGTNFPNNAAYIQDSGTTLVRWGGNASSTYNWKLGTYNADNDWFFEDFSFCGLGTGNGCADSDSTKFITDVQAAAGSPLMSMVMMDWVAQSPEDGVNGHWSFPASSWPSQCKFDQFNTSAGNGLMSDCKTEITAKASDINSAYFPLLDQPGGSDPPNSVYRSEWAAALAGAFGTTATCPVPYFSNGSCHFYDMDNETDIWGGTHFDIHPAESGYNELRDVYVKQARNLKGWDPLAIRFGPVSCCWYFYWNLNSATDKKSTHAGVDFLPWWLNEVYWQDQIAGTRSLDAFDIHAYTEASGTGLPLAQQQALALRITRDWWDPSYTSEAWFGTNSVTDSQALDNKPFRIPRMRAMLNAIYPGTPFSMTEWNFAMAGESDFSTALADAEAWGILGRERVTYSTRWTAADPSTPAYNALKLYRNYDGAHNQFDPISVSATNDGDPNLFSVFASTNPAGTSLTVVVVNKDPVNAAQTSFAFNGFTPSQVTTYTLSQSSPNSIVAGTSQTWPTSMTFAPYSATLLVITGTTASVPAVDWQLNPDAVAIPASGAVTLHPQLMSGSASLTLSLGTSDFGITPTVIGSTVSATQQGAVQITAGNTPGFYRFAVQASDNTTQHGWIVVNKPAATLSKTGGDAQTGTAGTTLPVNLAVTLAPGSSGGSGSGASVFFTVTSATGGTLTNVASGNGEQIFTGSKVIAVTNSSGVASVTVTLPATAGPVTISAEGPYGLGHPVVTFTATAN